MMYVSIFHLYFFGLTCIVIGSASKSKTELLTKIIKSFFWELWLIHSILMAIGKAWRKLPDYTETTDTK